jgi:hypothetical protein
MQIEILKVIIIIFAVIIGVSAITIPMAFMLSWLDSKGIIEKIVRKVKRK